MKIVITQNTILIDEQIVIDARKKISERNPKGWIDSTAYKEFGDIWRIIRRAYTDKKISKIF